MQILSMSMGFLGIQMGFAIQNANASRILQTYGAGVEHLSWFWIVAPLTGMIVQPIIGRYSDKTWCRLGRRRPFFLTGALITAIALLLLPNAGVFASVLPAVFVGAGFLMIMDAGINVTMEPFRALVADMLPDSQTTVGFSVQTFLIGIGAVIGSWLPYVLLNWFGIGQGVSESGVPLNLVYSFYIGAAVLVLTIIWTVVSTKEYSPDELRQFQSDDTETEASHTAVVAESKLTSGADSISKNKQTADTSLWYDICHMPKMMWQLGLVQFFSWIALFGMWVYTVPAVAEQVYGVSSADSPLYQTAGDWVGILFGVYNFVAMAFALLLIPISNKIGKRRTHAIALIIGGVSMVSVFFIKSEVGLIAPMIGIGVAWASILAMPYALLASSLPASKTGVYMGIFNFFITIPQIVNALLSGLVLRYLFNLNTVWMLVLSGVFLFVAALSVLFVKDN